MPDPINPDLAVALAAAAGLDTTDLEEQIRRQRSGDDEPAQLRARIAELEAQVADRTETLAEREGRTLLDGINAARSEWIEFGGDDGS